MMKTLILTVTLAVLTAFTVNAQFTRHEFSLHGAGGMSTLFYDVEQGERKTGFGGNAGLGYTFFFSPNWGISTGAEISLINAKYELSSFSDAFTANDGTEDFEFRYTMNNYTEKQRLMNLNIPLMLRYQTSGKTIFYAGLGGKVGLPLNATYKSSAESFTTSAYYPQYNNELFGPAFMGFGTFDGTEKEDDLKFKTMFMLSAEAGVKWKLSDDWSLYTGAFLDYGLNDISDMESNKKLLVYNDQNPEDFTYNSVMASRTNSGQALTDKIKPFSVGLKVAVAFGKAPKKIEDVQPVPVVDPDAEARRLAELAAREAEERRKEAELRRMEEEEALRKAEAKKQYDLAVKTVEEEIAGYSLGQTELSSEKKAELDEKVVLLKEYPDMKIICTGHTCDTGTDEVNLRVGMERAEAAKAYLINQGIAADRIRTESKGSSQPLVPNTDEENRKQNRRVEISVY